MNATVDGNVRHGIVLALALGGVDAAKMVDALAAATDHELRIAAVVRRLEAKMRQRGYMEPEIRSAVVSKIAAEARAVAS